RHWGGPRGADDRERGEERRVHHDPPGLWPRGKRLRRRGFEGWCPEPSVVVREYQGIPRGRGRGGERPRDREGQGPRSGCCQTPGARPALSRDDQDIALVCRVSEANRASDYGGRPRTPVETSDDTRTARV